MNEKLQAFMAKWCCGDPKLCEFVRDDAKSICFEKIGRPDCPALKQLQEILDKEKAR